MKAFFEEYGFVLVSIVVAMILVTIVPTVGEKVGTALGKIPDQLSIDASGDYPEITFGDE